MVNEQKHRKMHVRLIEPNKFGEIHYSLIFVCLNGETFN